MSVVKVRNNSVVDGRGCVGEIYVASFHFPFPFTFSLNGVAILFMNMY